MIRRIISPLILSLTTMFAGCSDKKPIEPMHPVTLDAGVVPTDVPASTIHWWKRVSYALEKADDSGRPVIMFFHADWCGYCKKMEEEIWTDPRIIDLVTSGMYVPIKVNIDYNSDYVKSFKVVSIPTVVIGQTNKDKNVTVEDRINSLANVEDYIDMLTSHKNGL